MFGRIRRVKQVEVTALHSVLACPSLCKGTKKSRLTLDPKTDSCFCVSYYNQLLFRGFGQVSFQLYINMSKLLKPEDLCDMLGVCRRTLTRWEEQGLIRSIKVNARVFRYDPEDVEAMILTLKGEAA